MRAHHAKMIRIGIMAKCLPYKTNKEPDPVFGGYFTMLDFARHRQLQQDYFMHNTNPLVQRAYERTEVWTSTRYT